MLARRTILAVGALGILAAFATSVGGGDDPGLRKKGITAAECERLVEQLVNPDKAPFKEHDILRPPKGTTEEELKEKQVKVLEAYDTLWDNFEVALPILVKHANDERFSFLYTTVSGAVIKADVGMACSRIIRAYVEVYGVHATRGEPINGAPRYRPSFTTHAVGSRSGGRTGRARP